MSNKKAKSILAFIVAVFIALAAGIYKNVNENERFFFSFDIPPAKEAVHIIDIGNQNIVKSILQPGTISIYALGKPKSKDDDIYIEFFGTTNHVAQGGKKAIWPELKKTDKAKPNKKGLIPINIDAQLPKESLQRYNVATMYISFSNNTQELGKIKFIVINSKYTVKERLN